MLASFAGAGGAVLLFEHQYPVLLLFFATEIPTKRGETTGLKQGCEKCFAVGFVHDKILLNGINTGLATKRDKYWVFYSPFRPSATFPR